MWVTVLLAVFLFLPVGSSTVFAQMLYLDDMPFFAPADSTSRLALIADFDRFEDPHTQWSLNRFLVTIMLPAGQRAAFFVRMPYASFDSGNIPAFSRWPWLKNDEVVDDWPHNRRVTSFGQPELGATGPTNLPFLPRWHYSVSLGLPAGTDRLYPFSSVSLPLRVELRKTIPVGGSRQAGFTAGYLKNMDSGKEYLNGDAAFPNGFHLGGILNWYQGRGKRMALAYDYHNREGRISQLAGVQLWVPWTEDGSVGLKVSRELQGTLDRPAAWYFTLSFRLDSAIYRPSMEEEIQ
jgi:hypothetical protein